MLGKIVTNTPNTSKTGASFALAIGAGIFIIALGMQSFYTVSEGYRAVILQWLLWAMAEPGFGLKIPLIDSIVKISVRDNIARLELPTWFRPTTCHHTHFDFLPPDV